MTLILVVFCRHTRCKGEITQGWRHVGLTAFVGEPLRLCRRIAAKQAFFQHFVQVLSCRAGFSKKMLT
jgi:hypothetical protein